MKVTRILLLSVLALTLSIAASICLEQSPQLYQCSGKVEYSLSGARDWQPLRQGDRLMEKWFIRVSEAEAMLIDSQGKMITISRDSLFSINNNEIRMIRGNSRLHGGFMSWIKGFLFRDMGVKQPVTAMTHDNEKGASKSRLDMEEPMREARKKSEIQMKPSDFISK